MIVSQDIRLLLLFQPDCHRVEDKLRGLLGERQHEIQELRERRRELEAAGSKREEELQVSRASLSLSHEKLFIGL